MTIYKTRYQANKAKHGDEIVAKVCDGYVIMTYADYNIWRRQK